MQVTQRIQRFNQGRNPKLLKLKYQKMSGDLFTFLRGTCHLFYEDWQPDQRLDLAPYAWISGDLHLENFGSYRGRNGSLYFNINDFDEAVLAPCTWELARFLTAILVAVPTLGLSAAEADALCEAALVAYTEALAAERIEWVQAQTATGIVQNLLQEMAQRDRSSFLNKRTELSGKSRRFQLKDGKKLKDSKFLPVDEAQRTAIAALIQRWAAKQRQPSAYRVLDVAHRVAGTGSLGLARYAVLVAGDGTPDHNRLLDLKLARSSALQPYVPQSQPRWKSQAKRITRVQREILGIPPQPLAVVPWGKQSFILRELQPSDAEVDLKSAQGDRALLTQLVQTMATVTAYGHLQCSGWLGAALATDLVAFARDRTWQPLLLERAQIAAGQVEQDFRTFQSALTAP